MWFCEIGGKYEDVLPGITDKLNNNETKFADVEEFKTVLDQVKELAGKGYLEITICLMNMRICL